jgi:hypothetical protein
MQMLNRWGPAALRFVFVTVALASGHLAILLTKYLYFEPAVRAANAVVQPASFWVIDSLTALGQLLLGADFAVNPRPYATRAALAAVSYLLAFAIVAALITIAWSLIDWRRTHYSRLYVWMRLYVRYLLGLVLMGYAVAKIVPTQFGYLGPGELLRSVGHLSRFDMLWTFMSVSPGYTVFAGIVEGVGAFLLFFSRTTLLGALVAGISLMNVVALDIAYDVRGPLLTALLLLLLDVIILLPYSHALFRFLLFLRVNDSDVPQQPPAHFGLSRWRYWALAKAILLVCLLSPLVLRGVEQRRAYFGAGHSVYGLFDVETLHSSGETLLAGQRMEPTRAERCSARLIRHVRPLNQHLVHPKRRRT